VWGLDNGYALMFGGDAAAAALIAPLARVLAPAPDRGWLHCGPSGAGHFVKMIHNGIEYGMMQSFAEGFALMENKRDLELDVAAVAEMWRHGSVVRSWLLDLTADFLAKDPVLADVAPVVADSGEGRWTVNEAVEQGLPAPVLTLALMARFGSQGKSAYADRLLAMMRKSFGGHAITGKGAPP
jgi:6-phosphogluconate dehydrogenase